MENYQKRAFEVWWNEQAISKISVSAPHMEIIVQSYKEIAEKAWMAGYDKAATDRAEDEAGASL